MQGEKKLYFKFHPDEKKALRDWARRIEAAPTPSLPYRIVLTLVAIAMATAGWSIPALVLWGLGLEPTQAIRWTTPLWILLALPFHALIVTGTYLEHADRKTALKLLKRIAARMDVSDG